MPVSESRFQHYLDLFLKEYNYSFDQLVQDWNEWVDKRGESIRSKSDFIWSMFNRFDLRIGQNASSELELYTYQKKVALDMLQFRVDEGGNTSGVRKKMNICDLMIANLSEFEESVQIFAKGCCAECEKIDGLSRSLNFEISNMSLPQSNCTRSKGCVCQYTFKGIRGSDGRLIMKNK